MAGAASMLSSNSFFHLGSPDLRSNTCSHPRSFPKATNPCDTTASPAMGPSVSNVQSVIGFFKTGSPTCPLKPAPPRATGQSARDHGDLGSVGASFTTSFSGSPHETKNSDPKRENKIVKRCIARSLHNFHQTQRAGIEYNQSISELLTVNLISGSLMDRVLLA